MLRIVLLLLLVSPVARSQSYVVVKDLQPEWQQFSEGQYLPIDPSLIRKVNTIYFTINANSFKGQYVSIAGTHEWNLFVNGKLILSGKKKEISIDSLMAIYSAELFFGVNSSAGAHRLKTQIVSPVTSVYSRTQEASPRPPTFFRDYAILTNGVSFDFLSHFVQDQSSAYAGLFFFRKDIFCSGAE